MVNYLGIIIFLLAGIEMLCYLLLSNAAKKFLNNKVISLRKKDLLYFIYTERLNQFNQSYKNNINSINSFKQENMKIITLERSTRIVLIGVMLIDFFFYF